MNFRSIAELMEYIEKEAIRRIENRLRENSEHDPKSRIKKERNDNERLT